MGYIFRDECDFHPEKKSLFSHDLSGHPLMQLDEIKKLALRHSSVRYYSSNVKRTQSLETVDKECPNGLTLSETLDNLETSDSFIIIREVQKDPIYGKLVNDILDEIEPLVHKHHKKMRNRQAWIFVTSPKGTTPYHRDQEGTHFFHIKGKKTFWVWDPKNREIVSQVENEYFHGAHTLRKTLYSDAKMEKADQFEFKPNSGIFFPYTAPHMVENGDEVSISFSVTHMSEEDYCTRRINKINQILRKLGLKPRDQFESYIGDKCKLLTHWCLRNTFCYFSKDWIRNG